MTSAGAGRTPQRRRRAGMVPAIAGLVATATLIITPATSATSATSATAGDGAGSADPEAPHSDEPLRGIALTTDGASGAWNLDRLTAAVTVEIAGPLPAAPRAPGAVDPVAVVEAAGGAIIDRAPTGVMLARVPALAVDALVDDLGATIRRPVHLDVRPEQALPEAFGPTAGSEVGVTNADDWHAAALTGEGVRVGVIDFFDVSAYWNIGEMGPAPVANVTARCLDLGTDCSAEFFDGVDEGGDDHGPAVVEIVKDMAPGAQIYIGRAATETDYYALIDWFASQGVRVISRSLGSRYDGPGDGRGALDGVADHAVDRGITWVNSGGNNAINRYYRAPVRLLGSSVAFGAAGGDTWLRFNGCVAPGGVRWANDWDLPPAQRTDYDVFLYHSPIGNPSTNDVVASALGDQVGGAPPIEILEGSSCPAPGSAFYMRVEHVAGDPTGDVLEILDYADGIEQHVQSAFSAATPVVDSRNAGVVAVGAVDPPESGALGAYSSQGPTNDGRVKPDLAAAAGFASTTFGGNFSGTSAAAPVVAGGAALLTAANLATGARELGDLLRNSVVDRGPAGPDNSFGTGEFRLPAPPVTTVSQQPSRYVPLASPKRILDTRPSGPIGPPHLVGTLWPGEILDVPIAGAGGVPASGVTAVAINLTLAGAARPGYGQVLPTLAAPVGAFSSFNVDAAAQTRPNFAIVPVGQNGSISIYSNTGGNAIVDVLGYFTPAGAAPTDGRFVGLATPRRVLDTRRDGGQPLTTNATIDFGLPAGVAAEHIQALVVNLTGTATIGEGFVQAYPGGQSDDIYKTSTLNLTAGGTAANTVIVPVTSTGVSLFADLGPGGSAHVIADVTGYITSTSAPASSTGLFVPVEPARAYDSRNIGPTIEDGTQFVVSANHAPGVAVPGSASGVVWNFTATGTTRYGFLKAWATGSAEPQTSALNWQFPGMTVANAGITMADAAARVTLSPTDQNDTTNGPLTHVIADVFGYFT
ncbi:MAG: S8 family serine peptidase [Ilumatobacteraceae bacterium]